MFSRKNLSRLLIPLMIEQVLAITIGMADTVMVASVGETAVSAVSLVDSINLLLINVFSALATGGAIVSAQYLGRGDVEKAKIAAKQLIYVVLGISLALMAVCALLDRRILALIFGRVEQSVMTNAVTYFFLSALSYPFLGLYNAGAALFRAQGNSRVSMFTSVLMNTVNICGNALLIFGLRWGVAGAAVSTLFSRILGAVVMTVLLRSGKNAIRVSGLFRVRFHRVMVGNILRVGVPNGVESGMFQIGKILVQGLIASFGTASIAASAVGNSVASVAVVPGNAVGLALITVVGQCVGAGEYKQAKSYILKLTGVAYAVMGVLNIGIVLLIPEIVRWFQLSPETAAIARELLIAHSICCIVLWPASFTLPNGLRAASDVKFTMAVSTLSMWIFRVGFSYVLGSFLHMGVMGVWIAMFIDWFVRDIAFCVRLFSNRWQNRKLPT